MGKSTISMAIFNSYVKLPEGTIKIKYGPPYTKPSFFPWNSTKIFRHLGDLDLVFSGGHWLGGLGNAAVPRSDSDTGAILRFLAEKNGIETSKTSTIVCVWSHKDRFQEHVGVYSVPQLKNHQKIWVFFGPHFSSQVGVAKAQQRGHILGIEIALVEIHRETCRWSRRVPWPPWLTEKNHPVSWSNPVESDFLLGKSHWITSLVLLNLLKSSFFGWLNPVKSQENACSCPAHAEDHTAGELG